MALSQIDACCMDLDLEFHLDKCETFSYTGREILKNAKLQLTKRVTLNLASGSIQFLGCLLSESSQASQKAAIERTRKRVTTALEQIDERPIRGEYKVWIYKQYVAASIFFLLAV